MFCKLRLAWKSIKCFWCWKENLYQPCGRIFLYFKENAIIKLIRNFLFVAFNDELVTSLSGQGFLYELQIGF